MKNLIVLIFIFVSYDSGECARQKERQINTEISTGDSISMVKTIKNFLNWYKANYIKAYAFRFTTSDANGNYIVDLNECEKYLQHLKSSKEISHTYLTEWRKYFKSRVQYFKDNPQNEGPPAGFDFDLVLFNQEPDLILNAVDQLKFSIKERNKATAVVEVSGEFVYEFELSLIKGKWKIDYISTANYD